MNTILAVLLAALVHTHSLAPAAQGALLDDEEEPAATISHMLRPNLVPLNRQTFPGNVLAKEGYTKHWIVFFCVDWYPPCQALQTPFASIADSYSKVLNNKTVLQNFVRFGSVDCAVDKVLCNEQDIETYPMVGHYEAGRQLTLWSGSNENRNEKSLRKWAHNEMLSSKAEDMKSKPLLTREERALAMQLLAALAACVSLLVWTVGRGADLWLALRPPRQAKREGAVKEVGDVPTTVENQLVHRLPREWNIQRETIEI